jgi:hypothetical protein
MTKSELYPRNRNSGHVYYSITKQIGKLFIRRAGESHSDLEEISLLCTVSWNLRAEGSLALLKLFATQRSRHVALDVVRRDIRLVSVEGINLCVVLAKGLEISGVVSCSRVGLDGELLLLRLIRTGGMCGVGQYKPLWQDLFPQANLLF